MTPSARGFWAAAKSLFAKEPRLFFGGIEVPDTYGEGGFMLVGTVGAGKTLVLDMLIQQALDRISDLSRSDRALIYDPKREYVSKLQQLGLFDPVTAKESGSGFNAKHDRECVIITNPLDERAYAWDMAKDFDHYLDGEQLAEIFTKNGAEVGDRNVFFLNTTKQLFAAVFRALLRKKPRSWTLRDFILAFQNRKDLEVLLSQHPDTQSVWREYLGEEISRTDTGPSIYATIRNYLALMSATAAAWARIRERTPERTFSFRQWVNNRSVILLGKSRRHGEHLELVNRLMFHKASLELLNHKEQGNAARNTWVFLDELPELGYLNQLQNLIAVGRSWGVRVVYGFQDYSQLVKAFGEQDAKTITNLAHTFGGLNCSDETSRWLSRLFGQYRDQEGRPHPTVPEEEFQSLPLNPQVEGVVGWYYSKRLPEMRAQKHRIAWSEIEQVKLDRVQEVDERDRMNQRDYELDEWKPEERAEIGILQGSKESMKGERKHRRIEHKGKTIEFACTDEEFETFTPDPDLLDAMAIFQEDIEQRSHKPHEVDPDFLKWADMWRSVPKEDQLRVLEEKIKEMVEAKSRDGTKP